MKILKKNKDFKYIHQLAINMIITAQNFIRENNDISIVSLKEIKRFNIFYDFFFDYLRKKREASINLIQNKYPDNKIEDKEFYQKLNSIDLQFYSIILAIFTCYYLRISDNEERHNLELELDKLICNYNKSNNSYYKEYFLELPNKEESYIIDNIALEKGYAKNKALIDSIFSLFVAINTKVPLFIVGKPGCSKSLSVQLINKAMKGASSKNIFFKGFPKVILNTYQGSKISTSEGVKRSRLLKCQTVPLPP